MTAREGDWVCPELVPTGKESSAGTGTTEALPESLMIAFNDHTLQRPHRETQHMKRDEYLESGDFFEVERLEVGR